MPSMPGAKMPAQRGGSVSSVMSGNDMTPDEIAMLDYYEEAGDESLTDEQRSHYALLKQKLEMVGGHDR